ncbi:dynein light intermediate chain-domain-containing protein [Lipomyces japonicus]|uniref:dynein light intermediate chain-domain-containing protein n=1 Tax=Lipomyces japonicus TaxID=56871 RepID=UPI0034CF9404
MDIWTSLLESSAQKKRQNSKTILILGGTAETQLAFLNQLERTANCTSCTVVGPAHELNEFGIGYLYKDVLDNNQEDVIMRLHLYTLIDLNDSSAQLLEQILQSGRIVWTDLLVVTLLDWDSARRWAREFANTVSFLKKVLANLDQDLVDDGLKKCRERYSRFSSVSFVDDNPSVLPVGQLDLRLGKGEYDSPIGVDVLVSVMHSEKMLVLETEYGRKDDEFDFIQQFLRTVLLKHGTSLVYLSPDSTILFPLVHYILAVACETTSRSSLLRAAALIRPNVVDRQAILIPASWDSWSKIQVIKNSFDVEGVSQGWDSDTGAVVEVYEDVTHGFGSNSHGKPERPEKPGSRVEISAMDPQTFLKEQQAIMNSLDTVNVIHTA